MGEGNVHFKLGGFATVTVPDGMVPNATKVNPDGITSVTTTLFAALPVTVIPME